MKATEIQLFDWVKIPDKNAPYRRIWAIEYPFDNSVYVDDYGKEDSDDNYSITEIEPIPLTPEILEKNGWVNKEEKGWMQKGNFGDSPLMLWYIKDTGKFNPHFTNELEISDLSKDGGFRIKVQCKYAHELQHAFRLCGLNELADNLQI